MCICYTVATPCRVRVWMTSDGGSVGVFWGAGLLRVRPWHNGAVCLHFTQHISSACSSHYHHAGTKSVCVWEELREQQGNECLFTSNTVCVYNVWIMEIQRRKTDIHALIQSLILFPAYQSFLLTAHPCYLSVWTWYTSHMVYAHCQQ